MHKILAIFLVFLSAASCHREDGKSLIPFDEDIGLNRTQFKKAMISDETREQLNQTDEVEEIPELSQVLDTPDAPQIAEGKLVSLTITEDIPLKDVLIELGRLADIEIEIDPFISGGVILIAKDRPFIEVVDQISDLADLRYSTKNGILRIERDTPYVVNYPIDFLDLDRSFTSSLSVSTSTSSDQVSSGGESSISASSDENIWDSVSAGLEKILGLEEGSDDIFTYASINKKAGLVSISATSKQHKVVADYINKVKENVTAQVLIEAKIIEVQLDEEFQTGINWSAINKINGSGDLTSKVTDTSNVFSLALRHERNGSNSLDGTLQLIENFGTTRTLSSPRLTALNNQQAILTFTENKVYFEVEYDTSTTSGESSVTETTIQSELKTVPIGIILSLQPSINLKTNEVVMSIRPTISSSSTTVSDPAVEIAAAKESTSVQSLIPQIQLKELDTLLKLRSGETMVIGGLIEQSNVKSESGVPWLKSVPLLGYFFKSLAKDNSFKETVIFIKATIISPDSSVNDSDRNFYKTFTTDPQPLGI